MTALPFTPEQLTRKTRGEFHTYDFPVGDQISLCIDYRQMGIGGTDSWLSHPLDEYRNMAKKYAWSIGFQPMTG